MKQQNYSLSRLAVIPAVLILTSCGALKGPVTTGLLGAGGAYSGTRLAEGNPEQGAAIGAVAGLMAGAGLEAADKQENQKLYLDGYEKGQSDAVKQLYWVQRRMQEGSGSEYQTSFYEVPLEERVSHGALLEPSSRVIPVAEPGF